MHCHIIVFVIFFQTLDISLLNKCTLKHCHLVINSMKIINYLKIDDLGLSLLTRQITKHFHFYTGEQNR